METKRYEVWVIPCRSEILVTDRCCIPVGGSDVYFFDTWEKAVEGAIRIRFKEFPYYIIEYDCDAGRSLELQDNWAL